ncbi:MAG: 23S rRNA (adenine(2503)-C(2))-methyltransferase RlmN [Ruminococcaceae bacterium]|nr:23S rRNA (adenine(2503)-C(2))-methyltransferase RlmN [Oscillospiraceae bacterium]
MQNLKDFTYQELEEFLTKMGEPRFRAKQIFSWLGRGVTSFDEMTNLSKALREKLEQISFISRAEIAQKYCSKLDQTRKYLLKLEDGNMVECVAMYYKHGITVCISCQVGCRMGCKFCASTIGGKVRDLTAGEMLDEVLTVQHDVGERISNIVMMGIGEPLDNFDNVIKFLKNVGHPDGLNIGYRHISLSTCGLVDRITKLAELNLPITLSVSLHAPTDEVRSRIMPVNQKYPVDTLIEACKKYIEKTNRRISFEYAIIDHVNDSEEMAHILAKKIKPLLCHVNLIPVNHVEENDFQKPSKERLKQFMAVLESQGINVTVRRELGSDIAASCGQLRRAQEQKSKG